MCKKEANILNLSKYKLKRDLENVLENMLYHHVLCLNVS